MTDPVLYHDSLVSLTDESIVLNQYYYPSLRPKSIRLSEIDRIEVRIPGFLSGKWRLQGTGDFHTWFPLDAQRPKRDRIFQIILKGKWVRPAFTVEDSEKVLGILAGKGLIRN